MRRFTSLLFFALMVIIPCADAQQIDDRCYELRVFTSPADKLDDLDRRFRKFAFPSTFARNEAWQDFMADPEWQTAFDASIRNGRLVESVESIMLTPTDYSPIR